KSCEDSLRMRAAKPARLRDRIYRAIISFPPTSPLQYKMNLHLSRNSTFISAFIVASMLAVTTTGCMNRAAPAAFDRPPAPVTVTEAAMQDVPVYLDAIGKTVARETVAIQPQVSGRIIKIHFT